MGILRFLLRAATVSVFFVSNFRVHQDLRADQPTPLQVHFIDVGTGDCIWIHTGDDKIPGNGEFEGIDIVIDGGDWGRFGRIDGYAFASAYFQQEINGQARLPFGSQIEWMILTHPHSDHDGGLYGMLKDYDVANILDPGHDKKNEDGEPDRLRPASAYGRFFQAASTEVLANGEKANFYWGVPDDLVLDWGSEIDARVLWSSKEIVDNDLNNTSIVLRLGFTGQGKDASFLFLGDAEQFVENKLVEEFGPALESKILKLGHHGSNSSTTLDFLRQVRPRHAIISSGNQAFSGTMLPRPETAQRIQQVSLELNLGTQIWSTERDDKSPLKSVGTEGGDDTVVVATDGTSITINYLDQPAAPQADLTRCQAVTAAGTQCKRKPVSGSKYCWQHTE